MDEIKYKRAMYEIHEEGINVPYLLDEKLKINTTASTIILIEKAQK